MPHALARTAMSSQTLKARSNSKVSSSTPKQSGYIHFTDAGICQASQYLLAFLVLSFAALAIYSVAYPSPSLTPVSTSSLKSTGKSKMELQSIAFPEKQAVKYFIKDQTTEYMTYRKFLEILSDGDNELLGLLKTAIVSPGFDAVFWECRPIRGNEASSAQFEFVVINSPELASRHVDGSSFEKKFKEQNVGSQSAISFQNLGKDATLIVPSPPSGRAHQHMTHLASFLKTTDSEHQLQFWMLVGEEMQKTLARSNGVQPFWLSTSGLGVSWLHVRIDNFPKYYNWEEYKM
jgi:hypothetical protein